MKPPEKIIRAWKTHLNERCPEKVAALYADKAILFPTFSPHALDSASGRLRYFESLVNRSGFKVSLHPRTMRNTSLSETISVVSGIYCFHLEIEGESLSFEARFSCVVDTTQDQPILYHHSSQVPRTLS